MGSDVNEDEVLLASEYGVIGPVKLSEMDNLVNAGLVQRVERDGSTFYKLTEMGKLGYELLKKDEP